MSLERVRRAAGPEGQWKIAWGKARDGGPARRPRSGSILSHAVPAGAQEMPSTYTNLHFQLEAVRRYIRERELHQRKKTFQEEYMELLNRSGIKYGEP
jgi:hypothetical protein